MAHDKDIDTSFISNPHVSHEESDVKVRPILMFVVWLTVGTVVIFFLMTGLFNYMEGKAKEEDANAKSPLADERNEIPPKPLLQMAPAKTTTKNNSGNRLDPDNNSPVSEVTSVRNEEKLKLDNYTWVDQSKGVVGLPIERAKELIIERGLLKSRTSVPPTATAAPLPAPATAAEPGSTTPAAPTGAGHSAGSPARQAGSAAKPAAEKKQP